MVGELTQAGRGGQAPLAVGEVHTALLQNSTALASDHVADLLDLVVGEGVRRSERPIPHAVSPDRLTGVDCQLPSASGRATRCVGTVLSHASITGGHVVQSSAYCQVLPQQAGRRLLWSHYLARPGAVEAIGKIAPADAAAGFVQANLQAGQLNLGAVSMRLIDEVQGSQSHRLDRRKPFKSRRTCLRWTVRPPDQPDAPARAAFRIESPTVRTLELSLDADLPAVVALCEDLALHDWLLTTLVALLERGLNEPVGKGLDEHRTRAERVERLRPAVDCLLHLWMPAARLDESVLPVWHSLDVRPGFTRQWQTCVSRIRDQLALGTMALLEAAGARSPGREQVPDPLPDLVRHGDTLRGAAVPNLLGDRLLDRDLLQDRTDRVLDRQETRAED